MPGADVSRTVNPMDNASVNAGWPSAPAIYEIDTWPWLERLQRGQGRPLTLADLPVPVWRSAVPAGVDAVWLMGVWPDLREPDVVGSPVPNHVAPDHPWTTEHSECFVVGEAGDLEESAGSWVEIGDTVLALGRGRAGRIL